MPLGWLADLVLLAHFTFVLFVLLGGGLVLYHRRILWLHLPAVLWATAVNLAGWVCPLTPLEQALRRAAGEPGYGEGFVAHYIAPLVYPEGLPANAGLILGVAVLVWNILVYLLVIIRVRHRK
ncbi:MAG: hypothetical protein A2V90_08870 [Gammaproteobacteria bacterium RBG_16_57_12]|nr:MAG: hypothetical protein A2V90_08870 [Gammaproteobacteria bacterium RBG_16_57_12]